MLFDTRQIRANSCVASNVRVDGSAGDPVSMTNDANGIVQAQTAKKMLFAGNGASSRVLPFIARNHEGMLRT